MKIGIKSTNLKLTPALRNFIEEKINPLEKFAKILYNKKHYNHLPKRSVGLRRTNVLRPFGKGKPMVEAQIEIGKETLHHKKGPFFYAECQMKFPKKSIRLVAKRGNLKLAINEVKDELQRELKEYKEKIIAKEKRKTRIFRKNFKISPLARFYRKGRVREEGI